MSDIKVFNNEEFGSVRTIAIDGAPWFVAKDVCDVFGVTNQNRSMQQLCDDEKGYTQIDTPGGKQTVAIVNEPGLYSLLFTLQPSKAKARGASEKDIKERIKKLNKFKRWVTHEVLPSIRRDGAYVASDGSESDEDLIARALIAANRAIERKNKLIDEMRPKALFADAVAASDGTCLVSELAKMMRQNGFEVGQNRLFEILRNDGFLMKDGSSKNLPTQRSMELGLFRIKETAITHSDGHVTINRTPKVTGKGQRYFVERYCHAEAQA